MKTVKKSYKISPYKSKIMDRYFGDMRIGVFDIETMGLNPSFFPMILSGLLTVPDDGSCTVTQHFAERPEDEPLILEAVLRDFEDIDYVLTYNGKHFDMPFVSKRAEKYGLPPVSDGLYDLDLFLVLNGYSEVKHILKNIKQKTVEDYMGLSREREDAINGAESIGLYEMLMTCPDEKERIFLEDKILLHNHDDVLQLYRLLPILKQVDIHRAFNNLGFPVPGVNGWPALIVERAKASGREFTIAGRYGGERFSYVSYDTLLQYFSCEFTESGEFIFKLPVDRHKNNSFVNLRLYFDSFEELKKYPYFIDDFLLVTRGTEVCPMESNAFARKFLQNFMDGCVCPRNVL